MCTFARTAAWARQPPLLLTGVFAESSTPVVDSPFLNPSSADHHPPAGMFS